MDYRRRRGYHSHFLLLEWLRSQNTRLSSSYVGRGQEEFHCRLIWTTKKHPLPPGMRSKRRDPPAPSETCVFLCG